MKYLIEESLEILIEYHLAIAVLAVNQCIFTLYYLPALETSCFYAKGKGEKGYRNFFLLD
jgi:hypothetical protein